MPLFWLSIAFLAGVVLGDAMHWPWFAWLGPSALGLASFAHPALRRLWARRPAWLGLPLPLLLIFLGAGAARAAAAKPQITPQDIAWYNEQPTPFILEGVIVSMPEAKDGYTEIRLQAERLRPQDSLLFTEARGRALAYIPSGDWRYGDRVRLVGELRAPPAGEVFDFAAYLARQEIQTYMPRARAHLLGHGRGNWLWGAVAAARLRLLELIYRLYPDPEASLLAGILLGIEANIPAPVEAAFEATGTSHIIAISGFNFAVLTSLLTKLFTKGLGKRRGALAAGLGIAFYTLLAGAGPGVVRAAILAGISLLARQLGRRQDGLNSLAFIAAIMALANPNVLWDVGFQLSFMATLGLILYAAPLQEGFVRLASRRLSPQAARRLAGPVNEYLLLTLAAQLTTLPVILYHFQRLSLASFLVNPLILPFQPLILPLGGTALLIGLVFQPAGQLLAWLCWPLVAYTIRLVEWAAARLPGDLSPGFVPLWAALAFYALLFLLTFARRPLRQWLEGRLGASIGSQTLRPGLLLSALGLVTALVWQQTLHRPDGRLRLTLLPAQSGEAVLIRTPTGRSLMINGGPSARLLSDGLGRRLPLGQRSLDAWVIASAEDEDLAALPDVLQRFPPRFVLWSGPPAGSASARRLQRLLAEEQIPVTTAAAGHRLDLGDGARLEVLAAGRRGAVLLIEWDRFRTLLPIGLDFENMETLLVDPTLPPLSALLLAEAGYAPANPPELIARLQPQLLLLSVQPGDYRGRPDPETLTAAAGYTLLRTDLNGWIEIITDGERMWVEVGRK